MWPRRGERLRDGKKVNLFLFNFKEFLQTSIFYSIFWNRLYQLAAKWGHKEATYNLGVFFAQGLGGVKKSFKRAKLCFEKAAQLGDPSSMSALAILRSSNQRKLSSEPEDYIDHDVDIFSGFSRTQRGAKKTLMNT